MQPRLGSSVGSRRIPSNNALGDFDDDAGLLQQALGYVVSRHATDELAMAGRRVRQLISGVG